MKKKIITLALVGVLGLGSIAGIYIATSHTAYADTIKSKVAELEEDDDNDDQELSSENTKTAITEEQAKQTALDSIMDGVFKEIELEDEDGVIVYDVEVQSGSKTYEVKVDANTGSIVKTEQDDCEKSEVEKDKGSNELDNQNEKSDGTENK